MRSNSAESAIGPVPGGGGMSLEASIWFWVSCFHERSFYFMNFCGFFSRSFFFLFGPFEPLYEVTAFCLTCSSQVGFEEGCKSLVGKLNSNRDGLYLSRGLAILSNAFPSDWERSLRFSVYPTLFPSNNTVPLGGGRWAWILLLSFWTQMTLKIYGMKLELLLCVSIHCIFFVLFTSFWFISVNFGHGSSVKWYSRHHIYWKTWHSFYSAMLCDYEYTLAQPVWHTLIGKGFQWPYSLKWPIYVSSTLSDMCFHKSRRAPNKRPSSMLPEETAGLLLALYPKCFYQVATCGLSGECLFSWAVGFVFSEDNFLVFISRS